MLKKTKLFLYTNIFSVLTTLSLFISEKVKAEGWNMPPPPVGAPASFDNTLIKITNWILGFTSAIAVLALIGGGIVYMTSAGDEGKAETGKKTVSYGVIGLVIAGLAYAIVNVIVTKIIG
ncbi:pilin [Patescibacteria group bacterium]|nr:pilin [Patescibacteria group bacterium]